MIKEFSSLVKIRFADCDPLGHLNNVKYLEYMLNAREDHVEEHHGFTYEEYARKNGYTWVAIENQIAYLKEVRVNQKVQISSKTIEVTDRVVTVEILMKDTNTGKVCALLWVKAIYFNLMTRKSENQPKEVIDQFSEFLQPISESSFEERIQYFRTENKKN